MDKRMFLAVGLCLIVLAVFQTFFIAPSAPVEPVASQAVQSNAPDAPAPLQFEDAATVATLAVAEPVSAPAASTATALVVGQVGDAHVQLQFGSTRGITAVTLPQYRQYLTADTAVDVLGTQALGGLLEYWGGKKRAGLYAADGSAVVSSVGEMPVRLQPVGQYRVELQPLSAAATRTVSLRLVKQFVPPASSMGAPVQAGFIYQTGDEIKRVNLEDLAKGFEITTDVNWIGLEEQYFIVLFRTADAARTKARVIATTDGGLVTVTLDISMVLDAEADAVLSYLGPKDTVRLSALGKGLEGSVDFGWFALVARPMLTMLRVIEMGVHNWGIAIILLTLAIKMLLFPLQIKFTESMYRMQAMKPQMDKLREKFKDDAMRMNQELAAMYKREGINPLGGCLPVLMQIPIFVALYNVLAHAIELRHAPFFGWMHDLSQAEAVYVLHAFGYDLPLRVLPVLMMGSTLLQNKMTPSTIDNEQQRMMMTWMPIIFTVLFYSMPSGLMIYWLSQNLITVGQNILIKRRMAARGLLPVSAESKK